MTSRWIALALAVLMFVGAGLALINAVVLARQPDAEGEEASAAASGEALIVHGPDPFALDRAAPTSGRLTAKAVDAGGRWSPLQSKDTMDLTAEFTDPRDGAAYRVVMNTPMREEPQGRWTTWFGVSLGHAHHGNTGIDTPALPRVASELALWGFAEVYKNGQLVAGSAPAHMMVVRKEQGSLPGQGFLSVATEKKDLVGAPDGYLNVVWRKVDALSTPATQGVEETSKRQSEGALRPAKEIADLFQYGRREVLGYGVLLFVLASLLLLASRPWPTRGQARY
jgi:hypothetical protein